MRLYQKVVQPHIVNINTEGSMSDGNYNRSLLPYNNYQSGLRAGRAQMRALAVNAFKHWLDLNFPTYTPERKAQALREYESYLS